MAADRSAGRMAQVNAEAGSGALFPLTRSFSFGTMAVGTQSLRFSPPEPGRIRAISMMASFPNTLTVDILINNVSIFAAPKAPASDFAHRFKDFGTDTTGFDQNINTDTPANRAKLDYDANAVITITVVIGVAAATSGVIVLTCDERQPVFVL